MCQAACGHTASRLGSETGSSSPVRSEGGVSEMETRTAQVWVCCPESTEENHRFGSLRWLFLPLAQFGSVLRFHRRKAQAKPIVVDYKQDGS